jgi:general secretion pathway protein J
MSRPRARRRRADAGFTMLEALAAIVLMGLIVGALASVTAQWMPNWNRSHIRTRRNEHLAIALDRLVADLSAAEYVSPNRVKLVPLFAGDEFSIMFVRPAVGPNSRPGLEIVKISETVDKTGPAVVRTRAPFVPLATGDPAVDPIPFTDPVVLLRAPLRVAFAYAGPDGVWGNAWRHPGELPAAVRFEILDGDAGPVISTATRIHAEMKVPQPEQAEDVRSDTQAQSNNAPETK